MALNFKISLQLSEKIELLENELSPHRFIAVAYSGGVDSTFLAWLIQKQLRKPSRIVLVVTPFLSRREHAGALGTAKQIELDIEQIIMDPSSLPMIRRNPVDRCYHCKREIMTRIADMASQWSRSAVVLDGTHADDQGGHRPGRRALQELGILSPLAKARLDKSEIRELSRLAGLPTWRKPSQSCLATRLSYGTELTRERLSRIEKAEEMLWDLGCEQVRVRSDGETARIEVNPEAFHLILNEATSIKIRLHFRELGFSRVSLDPAGYRSGSWDTDQTDESQDL
jgi:uncharacterized protein